MSKLSWILEGYLEAAEDLVDDETGERISETEETLWADKAQEEILDRIDSFLKACPEVLVDSYIQNIGKGSSVEGRYQQFGYDLFLTSGGWGASFADRLTVPAETREELDRLASLPDHHQDCRCVIGDDDLLYFE